MSAGQNIVPTETKAPSSGGEIVIRQFRSSDAPQVYALLTEGFVHGPASPQNGAQRQNITSPVSCLAYAGFSAGLGLLSSSSDILRLTGAALCLGCAGAFFYARWRIKQWYLTFCATVCKSDMENITEYYGIPFAADGTHLFQEQSPGGFWVAVLESPAQKTSEVVGYVGLDYRSKADPTSAEVRRMIVAPRHRRRRIGSLLMTALMDHARSRAPPLVTLELETVENRFLPGPLKLYESYGFRVVGGRAERLAPFFDVNVMHLTMNLAE